MEDETIRLPPPGPAPAGGPARPVSVAAHVTPAARLPAPVAGTRRPASWIVMAALGIGLLASLGVAGWWLWSAPAPTAEAPTAGVFEPVRPNQPPAGPTLLSEAEILDFHPTEPTVLRLRDQPRIFILVFPDLESQGASLNRVAALIEKRGQPRDRVLDDDELARAIVASGATAATYYYGHNYRGSDLVRFFALADRQGVALTPAEGWLRAQLALLRPLQLDPGDVAFISVPGLDGNRVDPTVRRTILHHELGHGYFFTNATFAAHVTRVWRRDFTTADRAAFVAFLAQEGYDPEQEEIMVNETMAYLLFTRDERFFSPAMVGLSAARLEQLRAMLLEAAPPLNSGR